MMAVVSFENSQRSRVQPLAWDKERTLRESVAMIDSGWLKQQLKVRMQLASFLGAFRRCRKSRLRLSSPPSSRAKHQQFQLLGCSASLYACSH